MIKQPRAAKGSWKKYLRTEWPLHLMMLLPVVVLLIYHYFPMGGLVMAFENYKPASGIFGSKWVGLDNFEFLFTLPGFLAAVRNTVTISLAKIVLGIIIPIIFSLMLNEILCTKVKKPIQTIVYMPHFISWVLMAGIITRMLAQTGIVNQLLTLLGFEPIIFLSDKELFPHIIIWTDVWKEFGYGTVIYLAAITGISPVLYEAAMIDGAGHWRQLWHVTLPGIMPTIILMSALAMGRILNAGFDQIFNLYSPLVYETGDIIDTFVYRMAFNSAQFSVSAAAGMFKSVISCILIVVSYRLAYKLSGYQIF